MTKYSKRFVVSGLIFLFVSGVMGLTMAYHTELRPLLRFSHLHMMMIGWVSMLIFGLGYHVIPRFCMSRGVDDHWQMMHWWFANLGLIGMALVPIFQLTYLEQFEKLNLIFSFFGLLQFSGICIFVFQMLKVMQVLPTPKMKIIPTCSGKPVSIK